MKLQTFVVKRSGFPLKAPGEIIATFTARDHRVARVFAESTYGAHVVVEFAPKPKTLTKPDRRPNPAPRTR